MYLPIYFMHQIPIHTTEVLIIPDHIVNHYRHPLIQF